MEKILYGLIILVCFFVVDFTSHLLVHLILNKKQTSEETVEVRKIPRNISGISDPLERYRKYEDPDSKLYIPIKRKVVNRIEIGEDDNN